MIRRFMLSALAAVALAVHPRHLSAQSLSPGDDPGNVSLSMSAALSSFLQDYGVKSGNVDGSLLDLLQSNWKSAGSLSLKDINDENFTSTKAALRDSKETTATLLFSVPDGTDAPTIEKFVQLFMEKHELSMLNYVVQEPVKGFDGWRALSIGYLVGPAPVASDGPAILAVYDEPILIATAGPTTSLAPEPHSLGLVAVGGLGMLCLAARRRWSRQSAPRRAAM
jgi:hypothetical protein